MNESANQGSIPAAKARTISLYEDQGISHTLDVQSSRRLNNSSIGYKTNSRKKKQKQYKEDGDQTLQYHNYSYQDDFESPNQSGSISESIKQDSIDSLGRYSISKEKSKKIEKPLTNLEINKLFVESNLSQKGNINELFKTKVYIDSLMNNRNDIEQQQSSIEYEQTSGSNQRVSENSKKQTINSANTGLGEKFPRQWIRQSQSPDMQERSAQKIDENDFRFTLAKVHKINAYEPKIYKQLQLPAHQGNNNNNKISTASTQQDQNQQEKYPHESESSFSQQNDNYSNRNGYGMSAKQSSSSRYQSPNENIDEIGQLGNNNNNIAYRKKRKLKKKNLNILQNEQIDNIMEDDQTELNQNKQPDGSVRVQANKFILSNRGSQMQSVATPSNLQKILNSTKQARRKSFVFHNSPRMIKNAYGVDPGDDQLRHLRDQFKEKVKEIQQFNKNHTNINFYKKNKQNRSLGRALSPSMLNQTMNGFSNTPKYSDKQSKQQNIYLQDQQNYNKNVQQENTNPINQIANTVQLKPSTSHSKSRRKSYNHPLKQQQLQLPQVLQNTVGSNTPKPLQEKPQNMESLFNYVNTAIPKTIMNAQTNESQNQQQFPSKLNPIRSKTPNIKATKPRNNSKNNNSPKRISVNTKQQNNNIISQLYQNTPRHKQI